MALIVWSKPVSPVPSAIPRNWAATFYGSDQIVPSHRRVTTDPGLSGSGSLFALDGERWCHDNRITWDGKTPPTAVDLRAGTEFPGFHGG